MLKVNVNVTYTAELVRCGQSTKGNYEMVLLRGNNNKDRIPIWVKNVPCGVAEGSRFIIQEITGAGIRHIKPSDRFDKWQDEFSIDAIVIPV